MKRVSDRLAEAIVSRSGWDKRHIEVVSYGLQAVLGVMVKLLAVLFTGVLLGIFREMLTISCTFAAMRMAAGGVHLSTYSRCLISGLLLFTAGGYISKFVLGLPGEWCIFYILCGACFVLYTICRYSPRDNPNRLIKEGELPKLRAVSFSLVGIAFLFMAITYLTCGGIRWFHSSITTGLVLEGAMLTDTGYKAVNAIEVLLKRMGGVAGEKV